MRHKSNVSVKKNPGLQILDDPKPEVMRLSKVALCLGLSRGGREMTLLCQNRLGKVEDDTTEPVLAWGD